MGLCMLMDPDFRLCRKRKLLGGVDLRRKDHTFDIGRKDSGDVSLYIAYLFVFYRN
jgi:hypothetical protein